MVGGVTAGAVGLGRATGTSTIDVIQNNAGSGEEDCGCESGGYDLPIVASGMPPLGGPDDDKNWSPKSGKTWGHTFSRHGQGTKNTRNLTGRARGNNGPQGQWLNNEEAAAYLRNHQNVNGPTTIRIPKGMGQVILEDGTIVPARYARIIPNAKGGFRTCYPVLK